MQSKAKRIRDRCRTRGCRQSSFGGAIWAMGLMTLAGCSGGGSLAVEEGATARELASELVARCVDAGCGFPMDPGVRVDTILVGDAGQLEVVLNDAFAQEPTRENDILALHALLARQMGQDSVLISALGVPIAELVPNHERSVLPPDGARRPAVPTEAQPLVRFPDRTPLPTRGLAGRHVAVWASHGWYYEPTLDRWEWQRARLFTTVEDILPTAFVLPYLAPMLERAGAHVWMPRERDTQSRMVVVDNDSGRGYEETCRWSAAQPGFAEGKPPYGSGEQPWETGSHRWIVAGAGTCTVTWQATVPEVGDYALYVSHGNHENATDAAAYTVHHAGGSTRFEVDQRMAAGTWVYVGTYRFADHARVTLSDRGKPGTVVSADAVRLGGGVGLIERGGRTSDRPRWLEGARYALQYDGMPASLVYNVTDAPESDYVDDYRNRGEWVNYLRGAPLGPNKDPLVKGLSVPIDVSLAFHTDAGITPDESTVGTLSIYSSRGFGIDGSESRTFNDGLSRFANRDLADRVQAQIVRDVRATHDSSWTRRALWDRDYSEAYRPNVPSMLLELLSHQNFADMKFGLDPLFRFDVSRAIYKGILRFVAGQHGEPDPVVAPLAPTHLQVVTEGTTIRLSWEGREDPLEPSASPSTYRVYTRLGGGGFDDGVAVTQPFYELEAPDGLVSFRVSAVNAGGESAPTETLATRAGRGGRVLVVNGFDRVGPPAAVDIGHWRGFPEFLDHGVPDGKELSFAGSQHVFDARVPWVDDDEPGHGATHADWETRIEVGNTFDYAADMGGALLEAGAGRSFDSVSDEALASGLVAWEAYDLIYLGLGEERAQVTGHADRPQFLPFPAALQAVLDAVRQAGVPLMVSGSYVTEELARGSDEDQAFALRVLGATHRSVRASRTGALRGVDGAFRGLKASFNVERGGAVYEVEAPEALQPAAEATVLLRYADTNMAAGIASGGVVTFGFPLETVTQNRSALLRAALIHLRTDP